jgi:hypothetical protein
MNDKIFLRASARNQAEIRDLVAALDTAPRRLMISVRQEGADSGAQSGAGVSGRVVTGSGGTSVSGRGHLYQSDSSSRRDISQQVQTIDGGRAAIMVGQSLQMPTAPARVHPGRRPGFGNPGAIRPRHRLRRRAAAQRRARDGRSSSARATTRSAGSPEPSTPSNW